MCFHIYDALSKSVVDLSKYIYIGEGSYEGPTQGLVTVTKIFVVCVCREKKV